MSRFKPYDYRQDWMVSISFAAQLPEGSLEYAFHHLIEERLSEEWFESLYQNDEIGRPAYSPKLLLKVILLGYARGIIGSRRLERACRENVVFMAMALRERARSQHDRRLCRQAGRADRRHFFPNPACLSRRRTLKRDSPESRRSEAARQR